MSGKGQTLQPEVDYSLTLAEISQCCGVAAERILVLVAEGVLVPQGRREPEWRFAGIDLVRARSALRLEHDLGVNAAGAALAIDLMEEMERLQRRVRLLESLVFPD